MSSIEDKVCEKIQERSEVGKSKYGVTMERTDLKHYRMANAPTRRIDGRCGVRRATSR